MLGIAAIMTAVILWGISFVNIRVAVEVIPAMTLGALRFIIASILLYGIMKFKKEDFSVAKEDYLNVFVAGAFGITIYFYFENNGVKYTSASAASLIIASIPVFSVIIENIFYKKPITKVAVASLLLSVVGVCMVVGLDLQALLGSGYLKGYLMMGGRRCGMGGIFSVLKTSVWQVQCPSTFVLAVYYRTGVFYSICTN